MDEFDKLIKRLGFVSGGFPVLYEFEVIIKEGFSKAFRYGVGKGALVSKWLFKKKKMKVTYELVEMLIVPVVQSLRGLITLKFGLITSNFAALTGRIYGMIKYLFVPHQ